MSKFHLFLQSLSKYLLGTALDTEHTEISKARTLSSRSPQSIGEDRYDENNSNSSDRSKKSKCQGIPIEGALKNGVCSYRDRGEVSKGRWCLGKIL